ncbi:MAG: hypothetical protein ACLGHZ_10195, partial [Actinomycetes bacterium]
HKFNIELTTRIIERLRIWGIAPAPGRYERVGTVRAMELATRREWTSSEGDHLTSHAGDYWVIDDLGQGRGVARDKFPLLYAPTGAPGTYRRVGSVSARRAMSPESVVSLEGDVAVMPGMWVLTDDEGDTWAVAHDYFVRRYRPTIQPASSPEREV